MTSIIISDSIVLQAASQGTSSSVLRFSLDTGKLESRNHRPTMSATTHPPATEFMRRAITLALDNLRSGGGPFGAVIAKNGRILAEGANRVTPDNDPTAHAEIVAIRKLCANLKTPCLEGLHDLLQIATLRHVHDGLPMGGHQPDCVWCGSQRSPPYLFRIPTQQHSRLHSRCFS